MPSPGNADATPRPPGRIGVSPRQTPASSSENSTRHHMADEALDGTEDVGRGRALVLWGHWPGAASGSAAGDLVLLPDPGLVGKPDLYRRGRDALLVRDLVQHGRETFLKCSIAPSACARWRGRADSLR